MKSLALILRSSFFIGLFFPLTCFSLSDEEFFQLQQALRKLNSCTVKSLVTQADDREPLNFQKNNGDESKYIDKRGSFNKGLAHKPSGFPNIDAFFSLVRALQTGRESDFNAIQIGVGTRKLVNPQAAFAYSLSANDAWTHTIRSAPPFASAESAGEMVELYWTALVRDVPFNQFDQNATVSVAIKELTGLTDFRGPKIGAFVTPKTFLRGNTPGDLVGPYISQFLYQEVDFGNGVISQNAFETPVGTSENDFLTTLNDWFVVQTGGSTKKKIKYQATKQFIKTPRDLTEYVHQDAPGQAAHAALLILQDLFAKYGSDVLDPNNPYINNPTQEGFVTFKISHALCLLYSAVHESLKAAWHHKWQINRRLRPEEYGFYVHQQLEYGQVLGIHPDLTNSQALARVYAKFDSYFLPTAYPEGSPVHPSYPAGHATFIGAAVTILKAFFNEDFIIPNALAPDWTNTMLIPYQSEPLTVGGELNKLAANISLGRDHSAVHYRSDGAEGMILGEKVAIDVLKNESFLFHESFAGFSLTKFDGTKILVGGNP